MLTRSSPTFTAQGLRLPIDWDSLDYYYHEDSFEYEDQSNEGDDCESCCALGCSSL